jgi:hypothetical protein
MTSSSFSCRNLRASIRAKTEALLENEAWDFAAVYHCGIDHFSHRFMRYHAGKTVRSIDTDPRIYQGVVAGAYRYHRGRQIVGERRIEERLGGVLADLFGVLLVDELGGLANRPGLSEMGKGQNHRNKEQYLYY